MRVSVFMDVEDPIDPVSDDAALSVANLFSGCGVRGSFCLTGDKCRQLTSRGRKDVIEAFRTHCLGLHTNGHSRHPSTMELLADCSYEDGCTAAFNEERKGLEAFETCFGRTPAFWGGAGNTWSPEINDALKRLGIPAYSYALTQIPDNGVHRFAGRLGLPQAMSISETEWADDDLAAEAIENRLARIAISRQPWLGIFVGHPTRIWHETYWDWPYFAGRNPESPESTPRQSAEIIERSLRNLGTFLQRLATVAEVIGVDEVTSLPWTFRPPSEVEWAYFRQHTPEWIRGAARWGVHRPDLDPENIVSKTLARESTLEVAELAE